MNLCQVKGKCVSTIKNQDLIGHSLLIIQRIDTSGKKSKEVEVAVDPIGCSEGEYVIVSRGSSARFALGKEKTVIDAVIVGVVDQFELNNKKMEV